MDLSARPFGHPMLEEWALAPEVLYLNHGTVGATPRRVLTAQRALQDAIERQPAQFQLRELAPYGFRPGAVERPRLRDAADRVAAFLGARGDDLVFVANATTGANDILRSLRFADGDEILVTDLGYGGVTHAARFAAETAGATLRIAEIAEPVREPSQVIDRVEQAIGPRTRLVLIDLISSASALVLPVAEVTAICRQRGITTLVDAAHGPGAIALDLPALGADFVVANLHKWAWAPRSSGVLWAAPERQEGLHPAVISWGLGQGFVTEFDLLGTRDPTPCLIAPVALDFLAALGFERVRTWNHDLAWQAAHRLAEQWQTRFEVPESMVGTMATIPLPEAAGSTTEEALALREELRADEGIEVQIHAQRGRIWIRICAQIYNEMADFDRLGEAVARRLRHAG